MPNIETSHEQTLDLVWGAANIGAVIGTDTRAAFYLLEKRMIPAVKVGRTWCASRGALRKRFEAVLSGQAV